MQFGNKVLCVLKAENFRSEVNNIGKQFVKIIEITHKILKSILYQVIGLKTHKKRKRVYIWSCIHISKPPGCHSLKCSVYK